MLVVEGEQDHVVVNGEVRGVECSIPLADAWRLSIGRRTWIQSVWCNERRLDAGGWMGECEIVWLRS